MKNCLVVAMLLSVAMPVIAATYYASPDGSADGDCLTLETAGTIALAVSKAMASGDVIQLAAGTYISTNSPITLSVAGITLKGATDDPSQTVIQGPGTAKSMTGVVVTKKTTICDLTISNYFSTAKGGVAVSGANGAATQASNLTAINCHIRNNTMDNGNRLFIGAAVYGGTWTNCVFAGNKNSDGNGGAADSGTFYNCHFTNNTAKYYGGAIHMATAYNCSFYYNSTTASGCCGGAVYAGTSRNCLFVGNSSLIGGAGAVADNATINGYFYDCIFDSNKATSATGGGALSGKGIYAYNCTFINNSASHSNGYGGAGRRGTYTDCYFKSNKTGANGGGGALYTATATRSYFDGNSARHGSGSYDTTANYCIYTNNIALTSYDGSGVALRSGTAKNCLIIRNRSTRQNTGIIKGATVINCTIVGNTVKTASYGAATDGTYKNCIILGNTRDIVGGTHSNSLYYTSSGSPSLLNCIKTSDAKFNAGKYSMYPYYALRGNSPARDAGVDVGWTTNSVDLLGKKRLRGIVDLGCYEYQSGGLTLIVR